MNTYLELLYETFYQMIHVIVMADEGKKSVFVVCMCMSILAGMCIFLYQTCTAKTDKVICQEFWMGIILLLPVLGLMLYVIVEVVAGKQNTRMMAMRYRKEFWLPLGCNLLLLSLPETLPFQHWISLFMKFLGTQEPIFAKGMICFLLSALLGLAILFWQLYKLHNMPHVFAYECKTEDGENIEHNKVSDINVDEWLSRHGIREIKEKRKTKKRDKDGKQEQSENLLTIAIELETGGTVDIPCRLLRNQELKSYALLEFEDYEAHTYAKYARIDHEFIVTNILPETDALILSYVISLLYGLFVSFPIYYCIIMNLV